MKKNEENHITETPFGYTLSLISGKWKMIILYLLAEYEVIRYNELQRKIGSITYKMLSSQLKELEADKLIIRKEYPMIPPKVEYSLTQRGKSLIPILDAMCYWGSKERPELNLCVK
ncbi:winged helix-turn-helix transcriptional regulator [Aliarcobacter butzleri]|uniref:winged helix-turn-helix transcriptional regulator n=1 Tax=Aliarcobacter butzleri TaxID=28197 RepID=UPI001EDA5496|nr:helix-turn-helix domain-containing protein [Aliarcobacter butzleri]MCG3672733.1 helix-turn-helix transcriptional regulator [Aliarcobacter butzleri]MCG3691130.1 helix-turn-helix transcriptional regulator [Aliarcobacter butzleri]